jgi:predicted PurR-regulated permease PerM
MAPSGAILHWLTRACNQPLPYGIVFTPAILMTTAKLTDAIRFLLFMFLFFGGLYYAKGFLVPLAFAGLLSMLLLPVSSRLEKKGLHRGLAIFISILLLIAVLAGLITLLGWQISKLGEDIPKSEQQITQTINKFKTQISNTLGISPEKQQQMLKQQQSSSGGKMGSMVTGIFSGIMGGLANMVLVTVYIFLLSFYRTRLKTFVLKLVPDEDKVKATATMMQARSVAQKYLSGMGMMILCLWIMYGIGFTIIGVKNALFFAILCGTLEIVPFVGNITGTALTIIMALTQGGGGNMVISILVVYAVVQFLQTYILEPLVVGAEVNINPLFTIIAIVLGELVWGIPGMVLAIPLIGIAKIICDHVAPLKPYGYLMGEDKKEETNWTKKLKSLFK